MTPSISRLLLAAATANGLSSVLDLDRFLAIDFDITVHLERDLDDAWLCTDATTHVAEGQAGHVEATFYDQRGRVVRATRTLLVAPRAPTGAGSRPGSGPS